MSIVHHIDEEKGITFEVWDRVSTADDCLASVRCLISDAAWPPCRRLHLVDLRTTSVDSSIDDGIFEQITDLVGKHLNRFANLKVAIIAIASVPFRKALIFERCMSRYPLSVIVFNSLNTACIWLGIGIQEAERALQQLRDQSGDRAEQG